METNYNPIICWQGMHGDDSAKQYDFPVKYTYRWSEDTVNMHGNDVRYRIFDNPLPKCEEIYFNIEVYSSNNISPPFSVDYGIYVDTGDGNWKLIATRHIYSALSSKYEVADGSYYGNKTGGDHRLNEAVDIHRLLICPLDTVSRVSKWWIDTSIKFARITEDLPSEQPTNSLGVFAKLKDDINESANQILVNIEGELKKATQVYINVNGSLIPTMEGKLTANFNIEEKSESLVIPFVVEEDGTYEVTTKDLTGRIAIRRYAKGIISDQLPDIVSETTTTHWECAVGREYFIVITDLSSSDKPASGIIEITKA